MSRRDGYGFLDSLDKENTCLGYTKSRPLTASTLHTESVNAELFLHIVENDDDGLLLPQWWRDFKSSFNHSLVMDRHFLSAIDSNVCIGSIDEGARDTPHAIVDTLRLILAQKSGSLLDFRELPVSLLRLYFAGQQRLRRFITRIPNHTLKELLHLLVPPDHLAPDQHVDQCALIERYFIGVLDTTLCAFERSLSTVVHALHRDDDRWLQFNLDESLEKDPFWANLPRPKLTGDDAYKRRDHCIWLTCVWRINVSLLIERYLKPWENENAHEWISYRLKLFRASHLDLMTVMVKHGVYEDTLLLRGGDASLFLRAYPSCARICCAEEMPDFVPYLTDNFKTGSELKERSTLEDMIGHIFINKTAPNICKIRNSFDIMVRYGEEYPIFYDLLKNVLKCTLLGHVPKARGSLNMVAAIKVNMSFDADEADAIISEEEWLEATKDKAVKRQRSKKKEKDELIYVKTRFKLHLVLCRHYVLFGFKGFFFYIAESSGCFNEMLSIDHKFLQYKEIVTIGNGRCLNELSRQAAERAWHLPFDWSVIEYEKKSKVTYDIKSGEIKKFHAWALKLSRKVWKGNFIEILAKKMTNIEEEITMSGDATQPYVPFYYIDGKETASAERVISLDELHFLCWCMSKCPSGKLGTRWLKVIGMSREGVTAVRDWLFHYEDFDIADNSLKDLGVEFQAHSMKDYMILKTVLNLIVYYKTEQIFHLPIEYAKRQIYALRNLLHVEEWEPTPPLLGFVYQCPGCLKYANTIVEPLDDRPRCPLHHSVSLIYATSYADAVSGPTKPVATKKKCLAKKTKKPKTTTTTKKQQEESPPPQQQQPNTMATSCFLNTAFFNMHNTGLYCSKYSAGYKHALAQENTPEAETRIIMRRRDNSIVIRSNKTLLVYEGGEQTPSSKTTTKFSDAIVTDEGNHFYNQKSHLDRQSKKDQWLLQIRENEFDLGDDDMLREFDNANEVVEEIITEPGEDGDKASDVTSETKAVPKAKKTNKKVIYARVKDTITGQNYTCNRELQLTDFIGIIKNGKALCVECGSMTEVKNFNISNQGITCNRHRFVLDDLTTPLKTSAIKRKHSTTTTNATTVAPEPVKTNKYELHPMDIVRKDVPYTTTTTCLESPQCVYCNEGSSRCLITVIGHRFKLTKVALCRPCFEVCRGFSKHIVTANVLLSHLKEKRHALHV